MTTCPRCSAPGGTTVPKGWLFELCPDHMLDALAEVRDRLADTVASLERAAERADRTASDRAA
jgi:hypothetical protein